jgi:hypothetical protein
MALAIGQFPPMPHCPRVASAMHFQCRQLERRDCDDNAFDKQWFSWIPPTPLMSIGLTEPASPRDWFLKHLTGKE